jgi:transposase-like protein
VGEEVFEHLCEADGGDLLQRLGRTGLVKLITEIVEQEVAEFLGRGYYQRRSSDQPHMGYRNGYRDKTFKTSEGAVKVPIARVRDTTEPFESILLDRLGGQTERLERMALEMYARGLSTRDIEEVLRDDDGTLLLGRSSVSQITEAMWSQYEEFSRADLNDFEVEYLWLDAVYEPMRRWLSRKEGILAAWAVCRDGEKVLLGLEVGNRESTDSWRSFLHDLVRRGLREPVLVITDGNPGVIAAVSACFPSSWRQRCTFHKKKNVLEKVPESSWEEIKSWLNTIYMAPNLETGEKLAADFISTYKDLYPRAVAAFSDDLDASLTHLRFPVNHRKGIRTSNSIERLFGEQRRRTKVIPRFFDEKSCLKLVFAALIRAARGFRPFAMNELTLAQLESLRKEKELPPKPSANYELANKLREAA